MKMNAWYKIGIVCACITCIPVAWVIIVKAVDVSRTPEQIQELREETKGGFKQVNERLDSFISIRATNVTNIVRQ